MTTKGKPVPKDAKNVTKEEKEALAQWEKESAAYAEKMLADEAKEKVKEKVADKVDAEDETVPGYLQMHLEPGEDEPQRFVTGGATYDEIQAYRRAYQ